MRDKASRRVFVAAVPLPPTMPPPLPGSKARPTPGDRRLPLLDLLRGAALFGIVLVNVQMMSAPYQAFQGEQRFWTEPADVWAQGTVRFLFEATSFILFSILFGVGFHHLMSRGAHVAYDGLSPYTRRLAMLAGLGVVHIALLWFGDVLLLYACCGLLLRAFRTCRESVLWVWFGVVSLVPFAMAALFAGLFKLAVLADENFNVEDWAATEQAIIASDSAWLVERYGQGSFGEIMGARWEEYLTGLWAIPFFAPEIFAAMLLGLILGRRGVLTSTERHEAFFRRLLLIALPVAVVGKGLYTAVFNDVGMRLDAAMWAAQVGSAVGGPAMAMVFICVLRKVWLSGAAPRLVGHVAAAGRMALTHYLLQSLFATTLFYSYGLGWYGRISTWQAMAVMIGFYGLQVAVSPWWFRRFSFGPLEALVRRVSYGRPKPPVLPPPLPT